MKGKAVSILVLLCCALSAFLHAQSALPVRPGSVRFAVIGDMGTGEVPQYEIASKMADFRKAFPFDFVIMLGDNTSCHDCMFVFALRQQAIKHMIAASCLAATGSVPLVASEHHSWLGLRTE
jgi:hypothetical protein